MVTAKYSNLINYAKISQKGDDSIFATGNILTHSLIAGLLSVEDAFVFRIIVIVNE